MQPFIQIHLFFFSFNNKITDKSAAKTSKAKAFSEFQLHENMCE